MKKVYIVVAIILIIVVIIVLSLQKVKHNNKNSNISSIENLRFSYTSGYMANSDTSYEIDCKDSCALIYKAHGVPSEEAKKYKIDTDIVMKIEDLLNKYNVSNWNGFHGNNKDVLDGDSFGFYVTMKNGDKIDSSGYMSWPKNYGEVKTGLESIFKKVIDK